MIILSRIKNDSMTNPIIKKVPESPVRFNTEKDGYIGSLSSKSKSELLELLDRQQKLQKSCKFLEKLPDKGCKIKKLHLELLEEIKRRDECDRLCGLISHLSINETKDKLIGLEWTGKCSIKGLQIPDEDEKNPLALLASHSGSHFNNGNIKIEDTTCKGQSINLMHYGDLETPGGSNLNNCNDDTLARSTTELNQDSSRDINTIIVDEYAKELCHRFDVAPQNDHKITSKFLPHKTLVQDNKYGNKKSTNRDVTSACPPVNEFGSTKMITLQESITLHQHQTEKLKEIQFIHAIQKLTENTNVELSNLAHYPNDYRNVEEDLYSDSTSQDDEFESANEE